MDFLINHLGTYFLPFNAKNPGFDWTVGLGPSFSADAFEEAVHRNPAALIKSADLSQKKIFNISREEDVNYLYEEIYFIYSEEEKWIIAFENHNDIGILFSNIDPYKILGSSFPLIDADKEFSLVLKQRTKEQSSIFNHDISLGWLSLRFNQ